MARCTAEARQAVRDCARVVECDERVIAADTTPPHDAPTNRWELEVIAHAEAIPPLVCWQFGRFELSIDLERSGTRGQPIHVEIVAVAT